VSRVLRLRLERALGVAVGDDRALLRALLRVLEEHPAAMVLVELHGYARTRGQRRRTKP
jgi:hypothetical protein